MNNVKIISEEGLCIGCGVCKAVCPASSISYVEHEGMYTPKIDASCIECGQCFITCPGKGCSYIEQYNALGISIPDDMMLGSVKNVYVAQTKDKDILKNATSGGVVTTLVNYLLENDQYDSAFVVNGHSTNSPISTIRITKNDSLASTQKSRYLPVDQSEAISYLLAHKDERIIFVGVPCFVEALVTLINKKRLNRDNYLIIGLFCDKTMSYNVLKYFDSLQGKSLSSIHFRTKEGDKWPGRLMLEYEGTKTFLPSSERMMVKDYFVPERCLYCLDKLNQFADISVGDNYTQSNNSEEGSRSVISRTARAEKVFPNLLFNLFPSSEEDIVISQKLNSKRQNLINQRLKNSEILLSNNEFGVEETTDKAIEVYREAIRKSRLGMDTSRTNQRGT